MVHNTINPNPNPDLNPNPNANPNTNPGSNPNPNPNPNPLTLTLTLTPSPSPPNQVHNTINVPVAPLWRRKAQEASSKASSGRAGGAAPPLA